MGGGIRKSVIRVGVIVKLLNPPCSLDVDQVTQIEVCVGCKKKIDLHMICSSKKMGDNLNRNRWDEKLTPHI